MVPPFVLEAQWFFGTQAVVPLLVLGAHIGGTLEAQAVLPPMVLAGAQISGSSGGTEQWYVGAQAMLPLLVLEAHISGSLEAHVVLPPMVLTEAQISGSSGGTGSASSYISSRGTYEWFFGAQISGTSEHIHMIYGEHMWCLTHLFLRH